MNLINAFLGWFRGGSEEEPLCSLPSGGDPIEIDDDEQAMIDIEMRDWSRQVNNFNQDVLRITGIDITGDRENFLDGIRAEEEIHRYIMGLKKAAYGRYSNGQYSHGAQTCIKALGILLSFKRTDGYSGNGEAEIWYMLAHMHACSGKFRTAKNLLKAAKKVAKHDEDCYIIPGEWEIAVQLLEGAIRSNVPPRAISNLYEARYSFGKRN